VTQPIHGQFLQEESNTVDRNPTRIFDLTMAQCFRLGPFLTEARFKPQSSHGVTRVPLE